MSTRFNYSGFSYTSNERFAGDSLQDTSYSLPVRLSVIIIKEMIDKENHPCNFALKIDSGHIGLELFS